MSLSREEEERLKRLSQGLGWTESFTSTFRRSLERKSSSDRHQELATMEKSLPGESAGASADEQVARPLIDISGALRAMQGVTGPQRVAEPASFVTPVSRPPDPGYLEKFRELAGLNHFSRPSHPTCDRCKSTLSGNYYKVKGYDICRRCIRVFRIRLWMLNAWPNFKARSLLKSGLKDLRQATRLEPGNPQVGNNIKNLKSLRAGARGNILGGLFGAPLWGLTLVLDIWRKPRYLWTAAAIAGAGLFIWGGQYRLLALRSLLPLALVVWLIRRFTRTKRG